MVRSYRRYEAGPSFGTVCSATSNAVWVSDATSSRTSTGAGRAYVGANEDVLAWDIKKGELLSRWNDKENKSEVTALTQCAAQPDLFAAGYNDGSIRIWDALSGQIVVSFNGHRSAISHLQFDREGARLASGSRDTDIILWNLLSETAEFRLRGHKDQITGLSFIRTPINRHQSPHTDEAVDLGAQSESEIEWEEKYLLSTSKDSLIKLWDLSSPHCVETHVAQTNGECWALGISPDGEGCITAGNDGELKVWRLDLNVMSELSQSVADGTKTSDALTSQGVLHRQGKDRTIGIVFHPKQDYIAIHGSEKAVELWRIRGGDEVHRHMQRKKRRRREKAAAAGETLPSEAADALGTPEVTDVFVPYVIVRTGGKVRSCAWVVQKGSKSLQLMASTTNNQLEMYTATTYKALQQKAGGSKEAPDYSRHLAVDIPGHRSDIRTLALSSDDRMLASASSGQLKVWNLKTQSCLRTLECGQALCSAFLPGDRIVLLGTKSGDLEVWDIGTSTLIESIPAHEGQAIWTLAVHPDGKSVVTGSADKSAKFWRFDVVEEDIPGTRRTTQRLKLTQTRQLKLSDDILSLCFSPDERLLAVATLDNTVKIFFVDSLKLFLTLYGHKLPVLNLSISSDSKLIATCSADKNVRIWGLDFGDCHKAFFAHNDSVMSVSFIPHPIERDEAHILFSASKDGVLKSWDGEKFEQIQRLEGHKGEIWAMIVGRTGETVITASHDKSLRTWQVGDDLIFLEEERERELEEQYESTMAANLDRDYVDETGQQAGADEVATAGGKQTITTLTHGEKIIEALGLALPDLDLMSAYSQQKARNPQLAYPQRHPQFLALGNISAEDYVLSVLRKIPSPALNDALLVLPFSQLPAFFTFLALFLQRRMFPELAWRITYFLLQAHMNQIISSAALRPLLEDVLRGYEEWQEAQRKLVGFNLAGLEIWGRDVREAERGAEGGGFVGGRGMDGEEDVEEEVRKVEKGRKKRAFASVA
ncbi:WD40 repeat-like protein [Hortaea werneckii]|nr:WD40 repeat-like protein [Hortaea werneckii]KAI6986903.1 WD40 repeat-like protein [Hortaea werneckii]KAI7141148.1 WD40 repeat-like protein [Hortaea werneckii]KAI7168143.1 WD40 repeat-like protein [Hortaea werneckii]